MDMRGWKKILLQWIRECDFGEPNCFNVEQTDIDTFYRSFATLHKVAGESESLKTFLSSHYPDFNVIFDEENALSAADYIYVYSLLLHFSCVQSPEAHFRNICQRLSEQAQKCIAVFFEKLLDHTRIGRENMRHTIAQVTEHCLSPAAVQSNQNESITSSTSSSGLNTAAEQLQLSSSSLRVNGGDSPQSTPRRRVMSAVQRISPNTPKTHLLEERTRELYNYKALLETERYEKGLLELQVTENEKQIANLNTAQKNLQQEIQELKNEILNRTSEQSIAVGEDDQFRKRLCKQIADKEKENYRLCDALRTLREEKAALENKLVHVEKNFSDYRNRMNALEKKFDEMLAEFELKEAENADLKNEKAELEHFISESRAASTQSRPDFNSSTDFLDSSHVRYPNTSSSFSSPENLASAVVDVQLREKEHENEQLREQISSLCDSNQRLATHIDELTNACQQEYNIDLSEDGDVTGGNNSKQENLNVESRFMVYVNCMDKLSKSYKNTINKLEVNIESMEADFEKKFNTLSDDLRNAEAKNADLEKSIEKLNHTITEQKSQIFSFVEMNNALQADKVELEEALKELAAKHTHCAAELKTLQEDYCSQNTKLKVHMEAEETVKVQYEKLLIENDKMKIKIRESDEYLTVVRTNIAQKEIELTDLGKEIVQLGTSNAVLEEGMEKLTKDYEIEKHQLAKREAEISELQINLNETEAQFKQKKLEFEEAKAELMKANDELQVLCKVLNIEFTEISSIADVLKNVATVVAQLLEKMETAAINITALEDKTEKLSQALRKEVEAKATLLVQHKKQIEAFDADLMKAQSEITEFGKLTREMRTAQEKLSQELQEEAQAQQTNLASLTKDCEDMRSAKEAKEQEILVLKTKQEQLAAELQGEKDVRAAKDQELTTFSETKKQLKLLKESLAQANLEHKQRIDDFERRIQTMLVEHEKLCEEIKIEYETRLEAADAANHNLLQKLEEATDMVNKRNEKLEESQKMLMLAGQELEKKSEGMKLLQAANEKETTELQQARSQIKHLEEIDTKRIAEISALEKSNDKQRAELKSALSEVEYLKESHSKQCDEIKHLVTTCETQLTTINETKGQVERLELELTEQNKKMQKLEQTLDTAQKEHVAAIERLQQELCTANKALEAKQSLLTTAEQQQHDLNAVIAEKETLHCEIKKRLQSTIKENVKQKKELTVLKDEVEQLRTSACQTDTELRRLVNSLDNIVSCHDLVDVDANTRNTHYFEINNDALKAREDLAQQLQRMKAALNNILCIFYQQRDQLVEFSKLQQLSDTLKEQQALSLAKCSKLETELVETQQRATDLGDEKAQLERRLTNECERFTCDIQNLEKVNEKLSGENAVLQLKLSNCQTDLETIQITVGMLKTLNGRLTMEKQSLEDEHVDMRTEMELKEMAFIKKNTEKDAELKAIRDRFSELQRISKEQETTLRTELQVTQADLKQIKKELALLDAELMSKKAENMELVNKQQELLLNNAELDTKAADLVSQNIKLNDEAAKAKQQIESLQEELAAFRMQLNESQTARQVQEAEFSELNANYELLEQKHSTAQTKLNDLLAEKELLEAQLSEKLAEQKQLFEELQICKNLPQVVENLKQQLHAVDQEKAALQQELELHRKEVEVNTKYQTMSESKQKSTVEALERDLLASEKNLQATRIALEQTKSSEAKLEGECKKLRESVESQSKRLEQFALKLAEAQVRSTKLQKSTDAQTVTIETLQRDKESQTSECKSLKERLSKAERAYEQLSVKLQTAEKTTALLTAAKEKLEAAEVGFKTKLTKLENLRQIGEDRLREMKHNYESTERENRDLQLQIGALNTEIQTLKNAANETNNAKIAEISKNLTESNERVKEAEELNLKFEAELSELRQEFQQITDQLSKTALALEILKSKHEQSAGEAEQLQREYSLLNSKHEQSAGEAEQLQREYNLLNSKHEQLTVATEQLQLEYDLLKLKHEQSTGLTEQLQREYDIAIERLKRTEILNTQLDEEKRALSSEISDAQLALNDKTIEINALREEVFALRQNAVENSATVVDKTTALVSELDQLKSRLVVTETLLKQEQETVVKLRLDNKILQAKYSDSKQRIEKEIASSEERIKENRLELEGKLEKMKNKMKTLYTEEVTKMKAKQDRETAELKSELVRYTTEGSQREKHARKLSAEIMVLNERILQYQKENTYLTTKLKHLQSETKEFKRPSSTCSHASAVSSSTHISARPPNAQSMATNIGSDLAMEDEEGEVFNNTYLTDLKNGYMPDSMKICSEELQHRNSLLPPHLKSAYAAQYDHGLCEDEVKDGVTAGFDDSMSALLNSNTSCTRKKIGGVTHYRKPGPPTPSKNGGRLSFGGSGEPAREILKEAYDDNTHTVSSTKTPSRFGFFSSRFSMGNNTTRDEAHKEQEQELPVANSNLSPVQPTNERFDLRRTIQKKNFEKKQNTTSNVAAKICTSTPRKSRAHQLDKRRLINELMQPTTSASDIASPSRNDDTTADDITPPECSVIETPPTMNGHSKRQSNSNVSSRSKVRIKLPKCKNKSPTVASVSSSTGTKITALQRRIRRRQRRSQGGRPSLCVQKNLYTSKIATPRRSMIRDLKRVLGRRQRMVHFDQQRMISSSSDNNESIAEVDVHKQATETTTIVIDDATYDVEKAPFKTHIVIKDEVEEIEEVEVELDDYIEEFEDSDGDQPDLVERLTGVADVEAIKAESVASSQSLNDASNVLNAELAAFDQRLEQIQLTNCAVADVDNKCARFEQLLKETVSQAPFSISSLRLSLNGSSTKSTNNDINDINSFPSNAAAALPISKASTISTPSSACQTALTSITATPHQSPSPVQTSSFLHPSRIIYGASVIYNRRLPNINDTRLRKSSIYFKNAKSSTLRSSHGLGCFEYNSTNTGTAFSQEGDVILVTNQTITLIDLVRMWHQMNIWTRLFVSVTLLGFLSAIMALWHIFYPSR